MLKAIVLGILQGFTEFLPVSSTAHLVLIRWSTGWEDGVLGSLAFDVALHAGTLLSLLVCFRKDISDILKNDRRLLFLLFLGTVPAAMAGVLFEDLVSGALRSPVVIAASLVMIGWVMLVAERARKSRAVSDLRASDALIIGFAQAVALVPGVSRSGITISAAMLLGLRRDSSARFAFLLSIPIIGGAAILEGLRLLRHQAAYDPGLFAVGFLASAISGATAITFMMSYLKDHRLNAFVYYRFALAFAIGGWIWAKA